MEKEIEMYGCTVAELREVFEYAICPEMLAISMLSDAQEYASRGLNEMSRVRINRAKWVMSEIISRKMAA